MKFEIGDRVVYVPRHASGNLQHPDCEHGVIVGKTEHFAIVRYDGWKQAAATVQSNLVAEKAAGED